MVRGRRMIFALGSSMYAVRHDYELPKVNVGWRTSSSKIRTRHNSADDDWLVGRKSARARCSGLRVRHRLLRILTVILASQSSSPPNNLQQISTWRATPQTPLPTRRRVIGDSNFCAALRLIPLPSKHPPLSFTHAIEHQQLAIELSHRQPPSAI